MEVQFHPLLSKWKLDVSTLLERVNISLWQGVACLDHIYEVIWDLSEKTVVWSLPCNFERQPFSLLGFACLCLWVLSLTPLVSDSVSAFLLISVSLAGDLWLQWLEIHSQLILSFKNSWEALSQSDPLWPGADHKHTSMADKKLLAGETTSYRMAHSVQSTQKRHQSQYIHKYIYRYMSCRNSAVSRIFTTIYSKRMTVNTRHTAMQCVICYMIQHIQKQIFPICVT